MWFRFNLCIFSCLLKRFAFFFRISLHNWCYSWHLFDFFGVENVWLFQFEKRRLYSFTFDSLGGVNVILVSKTQSKEYEYLKWCNQIKRILLQCLNVFIYWCVYCVCVCLVCVCVFVCVCVCVCVCLVCVCLVCV
jgi:hypothetical protein